MELVFFGIVFIIIVGGIFRQMGSMNRMESSIMNHVEKTMELSLKEQEANLKKEQDYECNRCHATIDDPSNISPSGDVKCHQCDSWFNVYQ